MTEARILTDFQDFECEDIRTGIIAFAFEAEAAFLALS